MVSRGVRQLVVAIDGPAGAGKSTVTKELALELDYQVLDTGALYRLVALLGREQSVSWDSEDALAEIALGIADGVRFSLDNKQNRVFWQGRDVSKDIRTPEVSSGASQVSALPKVRTALLELQQAIGRNGGIVAEGRDIGTVVFPSADVKFFLTASTEKRAERRVLELRSAGQEVTLAETIVQIQARDDRDSSREVAPLKAADDAIVVDCSELSIREVVDQMLSVVREREQT